MKKLLLIGSILFGIFLLQVTHAHSRGYLPPGGYLNSCTNCTMSDNKMLVCQCLNRRGRTKVSSLYVDRACGKVENDNGQLHCTGSASGPDEGGHGKIFEVETAPIWSQLEAQQRCDRVCDRSDGKWTGNWRSVRNGQASLCECKKKHRH